MGQRDPGGLVRAHGRCLRQARPPVPASRQRARDRDLDLVRGLRGRQLRPQNTRHGPRQPDHRLPRTPAPGARRRGARDLGGRFARMVTEAGARWTNWGRTYSCSPTRIESPTSEEEIVAIVRAAAERGEHVKVIGSGHSFTDIGCTDGCLIKLDRYNKVLDVDRDAATITAQAGITILDLSDALRCTPDLDPEAFKAAQVGLGALGVLSTVTLRCVPAYNIHSVQEPRRIDELLDQFDELCKQTDHFEFFWFPHTDWAQAITNTRTQDPPPAKQRRTGVGAYVNDILLENHVFGMIQRAAQVRRQWIPGLASITARTMSRKEMTDRSDRIFANTRLVRFAEMEYAVPRAQLIAAF